VAGVIGLTAVPDAPPARALRRARCRTVLLLFAARGWGGVWVTLAAGCLQLPDAQPAAGT